MARHRGFVRRDGRTAKRETEWFASDGSVTAYTNLAAGNFLIAQVLSTAELAMRPFTIVRTLGLFSVQSDQTAAAREPFGAFGGIVVQEKALALGATAVPDPVTQAQSDSWFLHQFIACPIAVATSAAFAKVDAQYQFDSKAMRKVNGEEDVGFLVANAAAAGAMEFAWQIRMLVKLH